MFDEPIKFLNYRTKADFFTVLNSRRKDGTSAGNSLSSISGLALFDSNPKNLEGAIAPNGADLFGPAAPTRVAMPAKFVGACEVEGFDGSGPCKENVKEEVLTLNHGWLIIGSLGGGYSCRNRLGR